MLAVRVHASDKASINTSRKGPWWVSDTGTQKDGLSFDG